jgi:hypothetical protein
MSPSDDALAAFGTLMREGREGREAGLGFEEACEAAPGGGRRAAPGRALGAWAHRRGAARDHELLAALLARSAGAAR